MIQQVLSLEAPEETSRHSYWEGLHDGLYYTHHPAPVRVPHPQRVNALIAHHLPHAHLKLKCSAEGIRY